MCPNGTPQLKLFKTCSICGEIKSRNEFPVKGGQKKPDSRRGVCRKCWNHQHYERYAKGRERKRKRSKEANQRHDKATRAKIGRLKAHMKSGGCVICGKTTPVKELHFHHINPADDTVTIAGLLSRAAIEREVEKGLVVLCAKCHVKVHRLLVTVPENVCLVEMPKD